MSDKEDLGRAKEALQKGLLRAEDFETVIREPSQGSTPTVAPESPKPFGRYLLLEEIGRGGMGVVYKAWDSILRRRIALKCLLASEDPEMVLRFQREARLAAQLSHPHIVPVHEVGLEEGRHFIAMDYIEGTSLHQLELEPRRAVKILRDVCEAVHYAHEQGVIHRDLKPPNLILSQNGHVWVMDFGIARHVEDGTKLTLSGMIVGTPAYMSPEQATGRRVDARSDVYSLGATLYQTLGGRSPFWDLTPQEILRAVGEKTPTPLRKINRRIDRDLEIIVMKGLEPEPDRRYATARALGEDLDRWLKGDPIIAQPPSLAYRFRKYVVRRKAIVAAGVLGLLAVGAALVILLPRLSKTEAALELRGKVSNLLSEAEVAGRLGDLPRAKTFLNQGIQLCHDHLLEHPDPKGQYFLGRFLHAQERNEEAEEELSKAIRMDPALGEARFERGLIRIERYLSRFIQFQQDGLLATGRVSTIEDYETFDSEAKDLRRRLEDDFSAEIGQTSYFKEVDSLYGRALLARLKNHASKAIEGFQEIVRRDPFYVKAWIALAEMAFFEKDYGETIRLASDALTRHKGCARAYQLRSLALYQDSFLPSSRRDRKAGHSQCLEDAETLVRLGGETAENHKVRGLARSLNGDRENALEDLTHAIHLDPRNADYPATRGLVHIRASQWDEAIQDLTQAVLLNPRRADAWNNRGAGKDKRGDREGAKKDFEEAFRLEPNYAEPHLNRAKILAEEGDFVSAVAECTLVLEQDPRHAAATARRGWIRFIQKKYEAAVADFDATLQIDPQHARAHYYRGNAYALLERYPLAIRDYEKALRFDSALAPEVHPKFAAALVLQAKARVLGKEYDQALADYEKAMELDPNLRETIRAEQAMACYYRGTARYQAKDFEGAQKDYSQAIELDDQKAMFWNNRGAARRQLRDFTGARSDYNHALKLDPNYLTAYKNRAGLREEMMDIESAIEDYEAALKVADPRSKEGKEIAQQLLWLKIQRRWK